MLIFSIQLMLLFHLLHADSISFADKKAINPITASTPYSESPMGVVMDIAPAAVVVADDTAFTAVVDTTVVNIQIFH